MSPSNNHVRSDTPPRALKGFEKINRYWDKQHQVYAAKILPGQYYVTLHDEVIVTVLGSCVSACIRDKVYGVGGMNHFMLPSGKDSDKPVIAGNSEATRYGNHAMEQMINDILKNGGRRENLEVKIFGGGRVLKNMSTLDIGGLNVTFIRRYLGTEGLQLLAEDVGDIYPRKVMYYPATGRVRVKKLRSMHNHTIIEREKEYMQQIDQQPVSGDVELF